MVYSSDIDIYLCKRNLCRTKVLWVLKFGEVGDRTNKNQNPTRYEIIFFSFKTSFFAGLGALLGTFLVIFKITKEKEKK